MAKTKRPKSVKADVKQGPTFETAIQIRKITDELPVISEQVSALQVGSTETQAIAIDMAGAIKGRIKETEEQRKFFTVGLNRALDLINGHARSIREPLEKLEKDVKYKLSAYQDELDAIQRKAEAERQEKIRQADEKRRREEEVKRQKEEELQRKIRQDESDRQERIRKSEEDRRKKEEEARKKEEEIQRKIKQEKDENERIKLEKQLSQQREEEKKQREEEMRQNEIQEKQNAAEREKLEKKLEKSQDKPVEQHAPPPPPKVDIAKTNVKTNGASVSFKKVTKFEVTEPHLVPPEFTMPDLKKIGRAVNNGYKEMRGVRIWVENQPAIRR